VVAAMMSCAGVEKFGAWIKWGDVRGSWLHVLHRLQNCATLQLMRWYYIFFTYVAFRNYHFASVKSLSHLTFDAKPTPEPT
jgi:hypothetical protein